MLLRNEMGHTVPEPLICACMSIFIEHVALTCSAGYTKKRPGGMGDRKA
jgi:hypothetical protein